MSVPADVLRARTFFASADVVGVTAHTYRPQIVGDRFRVERPGVTMWDGRDIRTGKPFRGSVPTRACDVVAVCIDEDGKQPFLTYTFMVRGEAQTATYLLITYRADPS